MKQIIMAALLISFSWGIRAQQLQIRGKVIDLSDKSPLEFANITLQTADSAFITGTTTDSKGLFRIEKVKAGELQPEDITEEMMSDAMYTTGQKDPDFILRPSGEKRLSNFMLWQAAYSELVEMDVLWPDFTCDDLDAAITEFNKRSRRFGGI